MRSFKDLIVWQKAFALSKQIYIVTTNFPPRETYSLVDQIRRASVSIPSNIAEGFQRQSVKDFYRFLCIAYGSCAEVETQFLLAHELHYVKEDDFIETMNLINENQKVLTVFMKKVQQQ